MSWRCVQKLSVKHKSYNSKSPCLKSGLFYCTKNRLPRHEARQTIAGAMAAGDDLSPTNGGETNHRCRRRDEEHRPRENRHDRKAVNPPWSLRHRRGPNKGDGRCQEQHGKNCTSEHIYPCKHFQILSIRELILQLYHNLIQKSIIFVLLLCRLFSVRTCL